MTTQPDDDSYPEAWKPKYIREREREQAEQRREFEVHVAALTPEELARIREGRDD